MELRSGYTRTEIGVVPTAWSVTPLARSAAIAHGFGFQSRYFGRVRGYRLMTPGHFHEAGGFKDVGEKQKFYDGPVSDRYVLGKGDLIVAMTEQADGLLGSAALVPVGGVYLHNQRLGKVTTLSKDLSLGFLYRVFNSPTYRVKVRETAAGTKVKHTSPSKLLAIPVAIPPTKAEQEAIAVVLSDADALIESLEQLLAKKRHLKQGAMQELLTGKKRLPGHNRPWLAKRLGDLGSFSKGSGVSKGESKSGPLPCVRYGEIYTRHDAFIREFHSRISSGVAATATRLQRGDILFAGSGETKEEIGKCVAFVDQFEAYAGGDIVVLRTVDADPYFLGYYLNTAEINRQKASRGQGDAVVHIGAAALAQIRGWFPPPEEQAAIAEVFLDIDTEIDTLEAKLTKARQIKQGMMQELLTGRIRLV